ncbi:MAG: amidophosphoribosyltransferase [Saccharofermentans sp.]|nr:amidophosphoribosyltransferase [Saccharofermentans sp.]
MSGVFGIINTKGDTKEVVRSAYYGIFSLQHRGQESAGIAVNNGGSFIVHKRPGLVTEVFDDITLNALEGSCAIGHARGGDGTIGIEGLQPSSIRSSVGNIALSCDTSILNSEELRDDLKNKGAIFQTATDSETILSLFSRKRVASESTEQAILATMKELKGVYSLLFMADNALIGVRDPHGIRPLCLGKMGDLYMLSSENCAFDAIGAEFIRDLEPGEIISISGNEVKSYFYNDEVTSEDRIKSGNICVFEYVYVARPDSYIDGTSVFDSRYRVGKALATEQPCDVDIVIGAPDSGNVAALGYADGLGVPFSMGLLKNRYVGRTFIKSTQEQRELAVRMKFAALKPAIQGKRIAIVDDSLVRGTTTKHIIKFLKENGAKEVHVRLASPGVKFPCCYGVNASNDSDLPASNMSVEEIKELIGADSLRYISLESLKKSLEGLKCNSCSACFDGNYIAGKPSVLEKSVHKVTYN